MPHTHAIVWLDFREARIFVLTAEDVEKKRIKADTPHRQVHHKAHTVGDGHAHDNRQYFDAIVAAVGNVDEWLIVGPGEVKKELENHVESHAKEAKKKLVGVEPMDHPSDGELLDHAQRFFKAFHKMKPIDPRPDPHSGRAQDGGTRG